MIVEVGHHSNYSCILSSTTTRPTLSSGVTNSPKTLIKKIIVTFFLLKV